MAVLHLASRSSRLAQLVGEAGGEIGDRAHVRDLVGVDLDLELILQAGG